MKGNENYYPLKIKDGLCELQDQHSGISIRDKLALDIFIKLMDMQEYSQVAFSSRMDSAFNLANMFIKKSQLNNT